MAFDRTRTADRGAVFVLLLAAILAAAVTKGLQNGKRRALIAEQEAARDAADEKGVLLWRALRLARKAAITSEGPIH